MSKVPLKKKAQTKPKIEDSYKEFVDKYWVLSKLKENERPNEAEIKEFNRGVWYCNLTGRLIHELQKFNHFSQMNAKFVKDKDDTYNCCDNDCDGQDDSESEIDINESKKNQLLSIQ